MCRLFQLRKERRRLHVFIDGHDITHGLRWANDETGEAEVLVSDANGHFQLNEDGAIIGAVLHGQIEFKEVQKKGPASDYTLPSL